jgi:hypothetical protein
MEEIERFWIVFYILFSAIKAQSRAAKCDPQSSTPPDGPGQRNENTDTMKSEDVQVRKCV